MLGRYSILALTLTAGLIAVAVPPAAASLTRMLTPVRPIPISELRPAAQALSANARSSVLVGAVAER